MSMGTKYTNIEIRLKQSWLNMAISNVSSSVDMHWLL